MQTYTLEAGDVLQIGEVRVAILEVEGDRVLLRIGDGDDTRLVTLRLPQDGEIGLARRQALFV